MKLQIYGMNIGRNIPVNVLCDHKPKMVPGHVIAQSFSLLQRVRALGPCTLPLIHRGGGTVSYR